MQIWHKKKCFFFPLNNMHFGPVNYLWCFLSFFLLCTIISEIKFCCWKVLVILFVGVQTKIYGKGEGGKPIYDFSDTGGVGVAQYPGVWSTSYLGVWSTSFLADIICERPLKKDSGIKTTTTKWGLKSIIQIMKNSKSSLLENSKSKIL